MKSASVKALRGRNFYDIPMKVVFLVCVISAKVLLWQKREKILFLEKGVRNYGSKFIMCVQQVARIIDNLQASLHKERSGKDFEHPIDLRSDRVVLASCKWPPLHKSVNLLNDGACGWRSWGRYISHLLAGDMTMFYLLVCGNSAT